MNSGFKDSGLTIRLRVENLILTYDLSKFKYRYFFFIIFKIVKFFKYINLIAASNKLKYILYIIVSYFKI